MDPAVAREQPSSDNQVRVIKHYAGDTEITGTPERIVILDSYLVEPLLALDIEPVGIAWRDIAYDQYPEAAKWKNLTDVGAARPVSTLRQ